MNCPDCGYKMSDTDLDCPRCKKFGKPSKIAPPQTNWAAPDQKPKSGSSAVVVAGVIVALLWAYGSWNSSRDPASPSQTAGQTSEPAQYSPPAAPAPVDTTPKLKKLSENFTKEYTYCIVSGEVKNTSGESLKSVEAVTTYYDKNNNVVKTDSALIDFNPILPGQTSPYKTMSSDNPAIKTERTRFQEFGGAEINTDTSVVD
ncbi:MAG: FxLYD domain-containing protein [Capsulimonas sp.]|uniref:FxLYD domain-containing protein n=1 Tax=Capsulimonas sp. TaxID=2494211 RepID=UPI003264791B